MTYLPDFDGSGPKLLVTADGSITATIVATKLLVYDISLLSTAVLLTESDPALETVSPLYQLNSAIFSSGISGASKITAMTFFEDVLYLLHDNARVIRGWDMTTATMVSEWSTPRVGGEFDKEWKGLAIQRRADASVAVHLALHAPPQIWSFAMRESFESGTTVVSFPSCAHAFAR